MVGRRVTFQAGWPRELGLPGDYCRVPQGVDPREDGCWYLIDPRGGAGAALPSVHQVVQHDDGTITCTPSLVMPSGWHGFLEHGVWRPV